jgi:MoaA/NifB/PqqE/SkfB family radical SAM enzyme
MRPARVVQVHPTRVCNLRCLHCYSDSGPEQRGALDVDLLERALTEARGAGYDTLGVSGGEPLMYRPLPALLTHARSIDMATTVTTNGMLLTDQRLAELAPVTSLLAISLDGPPDSHNRMRGDERAFDTMAKRLDGVRRSGIPFGFIFTLTQFNLDELQWVADFAVEQGAALLQVHPLEIVGRAVTELGDARPDGVEAAFAYLEVRRIRAELQDRLALQLDFAPRQLLRLAPEQVFAEPYVPGGEDRPLADTLSPLIVEPDGELVPLEFGFSRRYSLGNLHSASLTDLAVAWRRDREADFRRLCRQTQATATGPESGELVNWYELIHHASLAAGAAVG